jgi:ADP-ribose pyrophosphatase
MEKQGNKRKFNKQDVKINSVTPLYKGFFKVNLYDFDHATFNGGVLKSVKREVFERGHAVALLPYDPVRNEVVMIEQLRIGALATKESPWLLEIIAGMIGEGESAEDVAHREAFEEAGLKLKKLIPMLDYLSSPGGTDERIYLYLAIVDSTGIEGIYGLEHEQEDIRVDVFDYQEAIDLLQSGEIDNAATVICLQWLALNKQKVDQEFNVTN